MQNNTMNTQPMIRRSKLGKLLFNNIHYDLIGSISLAIGITTFAKYGEFAPGGISGISLMLSYLLHLPVGATAFVLNIPLIILSYRVVGKEFIFKTMRSLIISTFFMDVVFEMLPHYVGDPTLASVFSGVFCGIGMAMFYLHGSSSGGTDFLIMSIKVRHPYLPFGYITMILDVIVICLGWPVFGNINAVLYGLVCSFTMSIVMDKILYGRDAAKLLIIISDKNDEIAKRISERTGRSSTLLHGTGTYLHTDKDVLLCACSRTQVYLITEEIRTVAPEAFIMVTETSEIFGEGFIEK